MRPRLVFPEASGAPGGKHLRELMHAPRDSAGSGGGREPGWWGGSRRAAPSSPVWRPDDESTVPDPPAEARMPAAHNRLDFLDAARAAAALLVVVEHALNARFPATTGWTLTYVLGQAGVVTFFLISGFVVPMSLEAGRPLRSFLVRRVARLFPVYWLSLGLAAAYLATGWQRYGWNGAPDGAGWWVANAAMAQDVFRVGYAWPVYWTLAFEWLTYAGFAVAFAAGVLGRVGPRGFAALLVLLVVVGVGRPLLYGRPVAIWSLHAQALSAVAGLVAYRYYTGAIRRATFYRLLAGWVAAVGVVWWAHFRAFPGAGPILWPVVAHFACRYAIGGGVFLLLLELRRRRMPRVVCWAGERSYPLYLLHCLVLILLLQSSLPGWAFVPCLVAGSLALTAVAHRLVERPGIALGRQVEGWLTARPAAPAVPEPVPARRAA
ncbi:MAG: hypothetical protein C0501_12030 [Isosphaera sp.]|nr:hypothetical protein [Isosphaera sp.]